MLWQPLDSCLTEFLIELYLIKLLSSQVNKIVSDHKEWCKRNTCPAKEPTYVMVVSNLIYSYAIFFFHVSTTKKIISIVNYETFIGAKYQA